MTQNEKERTLCYAAGIIGSTIANPNHNVGVPDWLLKRSIRQAVKLIDMIMDDDKLNAILSEKE
jgi:hypothetical protein